ncbi:uncharacterized protein LOC117175838 [Belonocnema kinseyi]|uniref:uncharacterized protein LOC117175838 n=1 Tax=Belonocnema kinseyi TaxID=2817044 RepID=UPI00143CF48D|nr:uncharacterized protein LOC117175838 [Belonocnema kinseyi]
MANGLTACLEIANQNKNNKIVCFYEVLNKNGFVLLRSFCKRNSRDDNESSFSRVPNDPEMNFIGFEGSYRSYISVQSTTSIKVSSSATEHCLQKRSLLSASH